MYWTIFCHLIDNLGDIGVCWRLSCHLAARGQSVHLYVDDASALAWMAPQGHEGVQVSPWPRADEPIVAGEVIIEAFGCELPDHIIQAMASAPRPPIWINLEYLSAEPYVERCHRLPSPVMQGPGAGLTKWFFYPGFTAQTGGLLGELTTPSTSTQTPPGHPPTISIFCYPSAPLAELLQTLGPSQVLLAQSVLPPATYPEHIQLTQLPYLTQTQYDQLLRQCDLNFVRGEDSFVRAQWAARPFVWQAYPQTNNAHHAKLNAFWDLYARTMPADLHKKLQALWLGWNQRAPLPRTLPEPGPWQQHCQHWHAQTLSTLPNLAHSLIAFAHEKTTS